MLYAIISDIHANLEALERVLADAKACGAERVVCLGDVVGYGPRPAETLARVRSACSAVVAGNHDDAVSGRMDASDFIDLAGDAVRRHRDSLAPDAVAWLRSLPYSVRIDGALAVHGDATDPQSFNYVESTDDAAANFAADSAQLIFTGHTHTPRIFLTGGSGAVYAIAPQDFAMEDGKRYIVNPGSVGYPREADGKCMSSYVLFDSSERTVCYRFLPFSVASVMQRGQTPRRIRRGILAAAAAAIALVAGAATWLAAPRPAPEQATEQSDAALVVERRTVAGLDGRGTLHANLKLERGSAPAQLRVRCLDANGVALSDELHPVKASSTKGLKIPAGAVAAELVVSRLESGSAPQIKSFDPQLSAK
ncbi:MAG: metallophosphoesterase family protein [Kiritimatiellae bacterium]|nr:metallophosphoesterase family protein [Kiritimatiellia bacterium]